MILSRSIEEENVRKQARQKTDTLPDYEAGAVLISYPKKGIFSDWRRSCVSIAIA